jgi:hypothetical protein
LYSKKPIAPAKSPLRINERPLEATKFSSEGVEFSAFLALSSSDPPSQCRPGLAAMWAWNRSGISKRVVCIDELVFAADGTIVPVVITREGVAKDPLPGPPPER